MPKVKTVFEKKGMQLFRNGEHIATRTPIAVVMEKDCDKFSLVATKMLNSKAFNAENSLTPIQVDGTGAQPNSKMVPPVAIAPEKEAISPTVPQGEPARDDTPTMSELQVTISQQAEQIQDLLEMAANKAESVPAITTTVAQQELADELRKANAKNLELEDRLSNQKTNVYEQTVPVEDPYLIDTDDEVNPYGIPDEDFERVLNGEVTPMPEMDWRGTKTPQCIVWLEDNFPKFSKKRLSTYRANQRAGVIRAERKKKKEEIAKLEREQYPREKRQID